MSIQFFQMSESLRFPSAHGRRFRRVSNRVCCRLRSMSTKSQALCTLSRFRFPFSASPAGALSTAKQPGCFRVFARPLCCDFQLRFCFAFRFVFCCGSRAFRQRSRPAFSRCCDPAFFRPLPPRFYAAFCRIREPLSTRRCVSLRWPLLHACCLSLCWRHAAWLLLSRGSVGVCGFWGCGPACPDWGKRRP